MRAWRCARFKLAPKCPHCGRTGAHSGLTGVSPRSHSGPTGAPLGYHWGPLVSTDVPLQGPTATSVTKDSLRPTHSRPAATTREPPARLRRVPSPSMGPRPPWSEDATGPVALRPIPLRRLWRRVLLKLFAGMTVVTYVQRLAVARLLRHTCHNCATAVLAPLQAQGRGFMHPHAICASQQAVTMPVPLEFSAGPTDPSPNATVMEWPPASGTS